MCRRKCYGWNITPEHRSRKNLLIPPASNTCHFIWSYQHDSTTHWIVAEAYFRNRSLLPFEMPIISERIYEGPPGDFFYAHKIKRRIVLYDPDNIPIRLLYTVYAFWGGAANCGKCWFSQLCLRSYASWFLRAGLIVIRVSFLWSESLSEPLNSLHWPQVIINVLFLPYF